MPTISVTPGDIGQKTDRNNLLTYSITGEMSTITEKINGTVVNTRNATSGQAITLGLTQAQWDAIRFGRYANATGGKNTLTVEMGTEKWTYTFDKQLASDADIVSASKAVKDANEVYLPAQLSLLSGGLSGKGSTPSANTFDAILNAIGNLSGIKKYEKPVSSTTSTQAFIYASTTGTKIMGYISLTDIGFAPKLAILRFSNLTVEYLTIVSYDSALYNGATAIVIESIPGTTTTNTISSFKCDTGNASFNSLSCIIPSISASSMGGKITFYGW